VYDRGPAQQNANDDDIIVNPCEMLSVKKLQRPNNGSSILKAVNRAVLFRTAVTIISV